MTKERKIKLKILYGGRLLGIIETTAPERSQPKHISTGKQLNYEEKYEQEDPSSIKKVTSLPMKKITSLPIKNVTSLPMKNVSSLPIKKATSSVIKKHTPPTIKKKDTTSSAHEKIEKVLHKIQKRNRSWRRKGIAYN